MNETIDYEQLLGFLKDASLFEIYRLRVALDNELENPQRIAAVRSQFKEGDVVEYFDTQTNILIQAVVNQKNPRTVYLTNKHNGQKWTMPYHCLNINSREIVFDDNKKSLTKNSIKVGDLVGFNNDGEEVVGRVIRINNKTASLITVDNKRWRVSYRALYRIIEGDTHRDVNVIEHDSATCR